MNKKKVTREQGRARRHARVRSKIHGTSERPRLVVSRSLRGLFVQLIDDVAGKTVCSVNSKKDGNPGDAGDRTRNVAVAYSLGKKISEKATALKISRVVFDRSGHAYHGRIKAVADGARDGGLEF